MEIGLFFGSFNPIHTGHLIIANLAVEITSVDQVWFVVSPQNPFKKNKSLLHEFDRYDMVQSAIHDNYNFKITDVEFGLPRPSYTITTLMILKEKHTDYSFRVLIGSDNLTHFHKWKNFNEILDEFGLIVYPRPNTSSEDHLKHKNITMLEAPLIDISATMIRKLIKENKSIKYLVPDSVLERIQSKKHYL